MRTSKSNLSHLRIERNHINQQTCASNCQLKGHAGLKTEFAKPFRSLGTLFAVALMIFAVSIPAAQAQDPPAYELTWVKEILPGDGFLAMDINDSGVVVGRRRSGLTGEDTAFRFFEDQPGSWVTDDLNDLGGIWIDLGGSEPEGGWWAGRADGINASGQIVGTAKHGVYKNRAFVLSFPSGRAPEFELLPRLPLTVGEYRGGAINDAGVVVADGDVGGFVYTPWSEPRYEPVGLSIEYASVSDINNSGLIVTRGGGSTAYLAEPDANSGPNYTYTPGVGEPFENHNFYGVNDYGQICGLRHSTGRGRNRTVGGPFRWNYFTNDPPFNSDEPVIDPDGSWPGDINDDGDVCYSWNGSPAVYIEALGESIALNEQLMNAYPRGINNSGQICGHASAGSFILTPVTNDPSPGITVTPTSGLVTTETVGGDPDTFTVELETQPKPNTDVTIDLSSSDTSEGMIFGATNNLLTLTFTPADWDIPQTVTVNGVDDADIDGNIAYTIVTDAATSNDLDYNGLNADDVSVTNQDDDSPPGGGSETYDSSDTPIFIPDRETINSDILVSDDFSIESMTVNLDISHDRPSDLRVKLIGPNNEIQLSNFTGNNDVLAFNGTSTRGPWTLEVRDVKKKKTGTLISWSISVDYE